MRNYVAGFIPNRIDLSENLTPSLDSFLLYTDSNCLRQASEYPVFVTAILAKQYDYHVVVGHQGYDLQGMEDGGARVLIEEFKRMAGFRKNPSDMLNSYAVITYIQHNDSLRNIPVLKEIVDKVQVDIDTVKKNNAAF